MVLVLLTIEFVVTSATFYVVIASVALDDFGACTTDDSVITFTSIDFLILVSEAYIFEV